MLQTAKIFQDYMVLQRDREICVWGNADAGNLVTVTIQGKTVKATADMDGRWKAVLSPLKASYRETLTVMEEKEQLTFQDVAVGEVWIGAGQSNMEFHMAYEKHFVQEKMDCQDEFLRFYDVPEIAYDGQMEQFDYGKVGIWRKSTPEDLAYFSAVGYYFAKQLRKTLDIPVAIIGCNWGGTSITVWMSRACLEKAGKTWLQDFESRIAGMNLEEYWKRQLNNEMNNRSDMLEDAFSNFVMPKTVMEEDVVAFFGGDEIWDGFDEIHAEAFPGVLFENMVKTIIPYTIQGVLWYQGESDDTDAGREIYEQLLEALISEWRGCWENPGLPFLVVQLPGFQTWIGLDNVDYATIRRKQKQVADNLPEVWLCSISDLGEEYDIHPKEKRRVGERLALLAEGHVYGETVLCDAPVAEKAVSENHRIKIRFAHAGEGLSIQGKEVEALEIRQGEKKISFRAEAAGDQIVITPAENISGKVSITFAQGKWYRVNLYNSAGIPAIPFQLETIV